jgi:hypothetical protein
MKRLIQYRAAQGDLSLAAGSEPFTADYMIIDGQQRANAISLGFRSNPQARLWVDLISSDAPSDLTYHLSVAKICGTP